MKWAMLVFPWNKFTESHTDYAPSGVKLYAITEMILLIIFCGFVHVHTQQSGEAFLRRGIVSSDSVNLFCCVYMYTYMHT